MPERNIACFEFEPPVKFFYALFFFSNTKLSSQALRNTAAVSSETDSSSAAGK
jgi:hypothetical protein